MGNPLTLQQAINICNSYQFLEGKPYDKEFLSVSPILAIMIAPYTEQAQQDFMEDYDLLGYTNLDAYNSGPGYEVIVVSRYQPDEEICIWMDIRSFVKRNMIQVARYHKAHIIANSCTA